MTSQALEAFLNDKTTQIGKIAKEQGDRFDVLTARVAELTAALENVETTPAVDTALANVKTALDSLDASIPDVVEPPVVVPPVE